MSEQLEAKYRNEIARLVGLAHEYDSVDAELNTIREKATLTESMSAFGNLLSTIEGVDIAQQDLSALNRRDSLQSRLKQLSDDISFPNPYVWIRYKYESNLGLKSEMRTFGDFQRHCARRGDICHKRYQFLAEWSSQHGFSLDEFARVPLSDFANSPPIQGIMSDTTALSIWHSHEYYEEEGQRMKWHLYKIK